MINLKNWVATDDPRKYLLKPFNCLEKTVATNGHVMICIDEQCGYAEYNGRSEIVAKVINQSGEFVTLDRTLKCHDLEQCDDCEGTGNVKKINCPECDGAGVVDLSNEFHDYEVECASCEGDGVKQYSGECWRCDGSGEHYPDASFVEIDTVKIQPKHFNLLKTLPSEIYVQGNAETCWLRFRTDECCGVILGGKF